MGSPFRLRVVSWNVHGCVGRDGRFAPERTAAALAALGADVALLQEVGDNRGVHPPVDQAAHIAQLVGMSCTIGITLRHSDHGYGIATLARLPVLDSESLDLSVRGREPRVALRVVLGRESLRLTTLNVHLGLGFAERRSQLRSLLPALECEGRVREPLVVGGDFNDFPPGPVSMTLRHRLVDAAARIPRRRTFPSGRPLLRLDRVYTSPGVALAGARVDRSTAFRDASDHLPVIVDVAIPLLEEEGPHDPA